MTFRSRTDNQMNSIRIIIWKGAAINVTRA
jgi:hypothetical protein